MHVSVCVRRFGIAGVLPYLPVCVRMCVYCLGTNCAESTGSLFGCSCLKAGPLMNRSLSSRSGASEPLGNQQPRVHHDDRDCLWGVGGSGGCFPSQPAVAQASHTEERPSVCSPMSVCLYPGMLETV